MSGDELIAYLNKRQMHLHGDRSYVNPIHCADNSLWNLRFPHN